MPLPVPNLDDRGFDQLAAEARALIPKNFSAWTDHNFSDPGMTLLELFAFLLEAAIYQINRVPERSLEHFAELVGVKRNPSEPLATTLRRAHTELTAQSRAITVDDFEFFVMEQNGEHGIARAKVLIKTVNTPNVFPDEQSVQVIVVPNEPNNPEPKPTTDLRQSVFELLRERCLITTRLQVLPPQYTSVNIAVRVSRDFGSRLDKETVQQNIEQEVRTFLSPLTGGVDRQGWEFGRALFRSELYQIIETVPGVDHVRRLLLNGDEKIGALPLISPASLVSLKTLNVTVSDT